MHLIVAHDQHNIIGYDGEIPWHLSDNLKRFCKLTTNNIVIMGRKTFQSISKPLKNRINIVITNSPERIHPFKDVIYIKLEKLNETLKKLYEKEENKNKKTFVIGGSEIYNALIDNCDTMYITEIYRPYSNPEFIDPNKYSYFYYEKTEWEPTYVSPDYVNKDNSDIFYNFINYKRIVKNKITNDTKTSNTIL
jgi:dihydrofolate reductase